MRLSRPSVPLTLLALFLVICSLATPTVRAEDAAHDEIAEQQEDDDESEAYYAGNYPMASARVIFLDKSMDALPTLPAGSKANILIAYRNNQPGHEHTVVLVAGYLTSLKSHGQVIQNFSIVRQARIVQHAHTTSFQYSFTPNAMLEPNDYRLILGLYYNDNVTNNTYFATAFNETVTVDESLETDPMTILTYITLLAIFGGVVYFVALKLGLVALLKFRHNKGSSKRRVEVGTSGEGYDPDYISNEHYRYREAVLQRNASSSPSKKKK